MYVPAPFNVDDRTALEAFMRAHSFATLVTWDGQAPFATHIPLLYSAVSATGATPAACGVLLGHLARPNPQWRQFANGQEALAIFQGPHAYVSPAWYTTAPAVPTWNYTAVHAYGRVHILEAPAAVRSVLDRTVSFYEGAQPQPWNGELPAQFRARMEEGVVAFELRITRLEGKFKLSQNRSVQDRAGVVERLAAQPDPQAQAVAALMRAQMTGG